MPRKKKEERAKVERSARAAKQVEAQKKVAKKLKKPAKKPKTSAIKPVTLSEPQKTPTGKFTPVEEVPPQLREEYKTKFEEAQLSEIGKEESLEKQRARFEGLPTAADPQEVKKVRGDTAIPKSERPLTPKPTAEPEPTPGQQARRQAGRLPRGASGTGTFTFQTAPRQETGPGIKAIRDIARQSQKGRDISPLEPHVQATALALARRDHEIARGTGKTVNGIDPDSVTPDQYSIRGTHHERLAEVIHGYGVKEEDFNKLPGKGDLPTKVSFAWSALKEHERSKRKVGLYPESEGATHWEDPRTKKVAPLSMGGHPEFYRHEGQTQSLIKGTGESAWKAVTPTTQGWHVINLRGQKTWTFRGHPAEPYKDTHQVRSLFQHLQNTLSGEFPEAPITTGTASADSRVRAAERVREKFVVMRPESAEKSMFSKRATKESGFLRERGRTKRTMVAAPDNVTIENTPETEFVTGPKRIEPRRPKEVQEASGRRVVRPRRRDESKKVGFISQPLTISKQMTQKGVNLSSLKPTNLSPTKIGPNGEILRSQPTIKKGAKVKVEKTLKNKTNIKIVPTYEVKPGPVDQPLPGMESYGYQEPAKKASRYWRGTLGTESFVDKKTGQVITANLPKEKAFQGKWVETPATPATPGSARPTPQPEFAGETGIEQLKFYKEKHGGVVPSASREVVKRSKKTPVLKPKPASTILSGTDEAATRNIPQQLELPGFESPGYAGAMGQQFRRVSPATTELQLKAQQGAVPGVASELPRGVEKKKSTRSFKGRR